MNPMRSTRLAIGATLALAVAITPTAALAHAELVSSSPAAGDALTAPPETVTLVFDGELVPDGTGFVVTDADGGVVGDGGLDLTVAERDEIAGDVAIRGAGTYTVAWTAVAADGHEERGDFAFTVAAPPNTAVTPARWDALDELGSMVLIVALAIGLRRARRADP
jgi:methionine-rich copper-binding protein CopC